MKNSKEMLEELFARREKYFMERRKKIRNLKKVISTTVGCLVVMFIVGIPAIYYFGGSENDSLQSESNTGKVETDQSASIIKGMMPRDADSTEKRDSESESEMIDNLNDPNEAADAETETANMEGEIPTEKTGKDVPGPGPDSLGSTGGLVPYEPVWGKCYQNEAGKWVVFLTENTPENQKKVLELNPTLTENDIIFQSITFSRSYLESLMISIGQAADENEEFSFVSSIGLRTEKNCVEVDVTTDDEESIAKILAFDTIGGGSAIEIVNLNDYIVPIEAQKAPKP